ncbi:MAG: MazG nucleotide pyrophosphohydrolase domain-containing protein [Opitutus sp.]
MEIRARFAALNEKNGHRTWTREDVMQGFVVDVGDLMKLVMAKSGSRDVTDVDRKLAHELADCLWSVLVLAQLYEIDLEKAYLSTMDQLSTDLQAKMGPTISAGLMKQEPRMDTTSHEGARCAD